MTSPFISLQNITIRIADKIFFENTSWEINKGEQWVIIGPNGSGKSTLAKAIAGILPLKHGKIILHFVKDRHPYPFVHKDKIAYVSFEAQQNMLKKDSLKRDLESYVGVGKAGTRVKDFINNLDDNLISKEFLDREIATLSTGEMRKVFLTKAFLQKPKLLILDEPFDGLDMDSKKTLMDMIEDIMKKIQVMIIVHNPNEIPDCITHVLLTYNTQIKDFGEKEYIFKKYKIENAGSNKIYDTFSLHHDSSNFNKNVSKFSLRSKRFPLIQMKNVSVKIENKKILDNITWQMRDGENWAILGPNGAGKSTLISLIIGDQLQSYSNDITIFGKDRQNISLWEIKKNIGITSSDLMIKHQYDLSAFDVILSGFFDSIGLYKKATDQQKKETMVWVKKLRLQNLIDKNFQGLSYGQKRLILIARSVIKSPKILILDEPCHGLDTENRRRVLDMVENIVSNPPKARQAKTQLILITHNQDEIVPSITNILKLEHGQKVN